MNVLYWLWIAAFAAALWVTIFAALLAVVLLVRHLKSADLEEDEE